MTSENKNPKERLRVRLPGAEGYASDADYLETDFLLRRLLAGEMEKVRDRLAAAAAAFGEEGRLREKFSEALRATASLREELAPSSAEERRSKGHSESDEERLIELDLALLDKVEGLNSPMDGLERVSSSGSMLEDLAVYEEGLSEIQELFRLRERISRGLP